MRARMSKHETIDIPFDMSKSLKEIEDELQEVDIAFYKYKGFDITTKQGRSAALKWTKKALPDDMFWTDAPEDGSDEMDLIVGRMRRDRYIRLLAEDNE